MNEGTEVKASGQSYDWRGPRYADKQQFGALVIGGDYKSLGTVRSLGRKKIPVWVLMDDHLIAGVSRYALKRLKWPLASEEEQVEYLLGLNDRYGLLGWAVIPGTDESAATIARYYRVLSQRYRLTVPPWEILEWAHDKRMTYRLASMLGVPYPATHAFSCVDEVVQFRCDFPVILKPATKPTLNPFTRERAWRVDDHQSLLRRFDEARTMVNVSTILVQEVIPGGSEGQFSFAALCLDGQVLAHLVARRVRQFPIDFARSSTFVETVDQQEVEGAGRRIIQKMNFSGLIEIEFKQDPRDGLYKLLDMNPRIWGWHTLGKAAGIDFSYLLWRLVQGERFSGMSGRAGVRWMRVLTDIVAAGAEVRRGRLSLSTYVGSLIRGPIEPAIFAADDPLPALLEFPLGISLILKRRWV